MKIKSARNAAFILEKLLANLNIETSKHPIHFNPNGAHTQLRNKRNGKRYHIKFCKEPFYSFGKIFRQYAGQVGETLDFKILEDLKPEDQLFFCYPDKIYSILVSDFNENALLRTNDRDSDTKTLSIPIKLLNRFH